MNKSLDYNLLLEDHKNKKRLKHNLKFPLYVETKYDGNYVRVKVQSGRATFITSGNLTYTHWDSNNSFFNDLPDGVYLCERIGTDGKLGDRVKCNLTGPKTAQISRGHTYKIHDWLPVRDWVEGSTILDFSTRRTMLLGLNIPDVVSSVLVNSKEELELILKEVVNQGYEGIMIKSPEWKWKRTNSRNIEFCKYKKRRTADLLCIDTTPGEGKYVGKIGALVLVDSDGRRVQVGSGLSNADRAKPDNYFIGSVIEIEYEQIIDTYIQPTYITVRHDKDKGD